MNISKKIALVTGTSFVTASIALTGASIAVADSEQNVWRGGGQGEVVSGQAARTGGIPDRAIVVAQGEVRVSDPLTVTGGVVNRPSFKANPETISVTWDPQNVCNRAVGKGLSAPGCWTRPQP